MDHGNDLAVPRPKPQTFGAGSLNCGGYEQPPEAPPLPGLPQAGMGLRRHMEPSGVVPLVVDIAGMVV